MPALEILRLTDAVRQEHYQPFTTLHTDAAILSQLRRSGQLIEIEWLALPVASPLAGRTISAADVRRQTGASNVVTLHNDTLFANPGPDHLLLAVMVLAVLGTAGQREVFRSRYELQRQGVPLLTPGASLAAQPG
jgi:K+/H+ antiporter YhaU regulatory subunit KhtT